MKHIFLVRHAEPLFPNGEKLCLGHTDLELSELGVLQAKITAQFLSFYPIPRVYSSDLKRSMQTASELVLDEAEIVVRNELRELDAGEWDGVSFREIKERYHELYSARFTDPSIPPPSGETYYSAAQRFKKVMDEILLTQDEEIVIVAHSGIIRAFLCDVLDIAYSKNREIELAYSSVTQLVYDNGKFTIKYTGYVPAKAPTESQIMAMYFKYETPLPIIDHNIAVMGKALEISDYCVEKNEPVDRALIAAAALLHDIDRENPNHAEEGFRILTEEGYPQVAEIILKHHDLDIEEAQLTATGIVHLADKLINGTEETTIEKRFEKSLRKCTDNASKAAHQRRLATATKLNEAYKNLKGLSE